MNSTSEIERQKEAAIDALRLKAFETNSDADRQAYFDAVSKWFQDRHIRRVNAERVPFLPVQGAVKKLEETLRELITEQSEGEWDEKTIEKDVRKFSARILSALEPSAARELALEEAAKNCEREAAEVEGLIDDVAYHLRKRAAAIRALSSPDHADAGKVEGDGWRPIDEAAKSGRIVRIAYNRDDVTMADAFYRDGKWHAACVFYRSGVGKPPYEFREHKVLESLVFAYRPLPSAPSEGAE